jgi:hypothetical protein
MDLATTRRELIAMRTKHAGNKVVTTRISTLISQLERLAEEPMPEHASRLRKAIARSMAEIRQIVADGGRYIPENHPRHGVIAANRGGAA